MFRFFSGPAKVVASLVLRLLASLPACQQMNPRKSCGQLPGFAGAAFATDGNEISQTGT